MTAGAVTLWCTEGRTVLCNTHLIRELRVLSEQGAAWAGALIEVLLEHEPDYLLVPFPT